MKIKRMRMSSRSKNITQKEVKVNLNNRKTKVENSTYLAIWLSEYGTSELSARLAKGNQCIATKLRIYTTMQGRAGRKDIFRKNFDEKKEGNTRIVSREKKLIHVRDTGQYLLHNL